MIIIGFPTTDKIGFIITKVGGVKSRVGLTYLKKTIKTYCCPPAYRRVDTLSHLGYTLGNQYSQSTFGAGCGSVLIQFPTGGHPHAVGQPTSMNQCMNRCESGAGGTVRMKEGLASRSRISPSAPNYQRGAFLMTTRTPLQQIGRAHV